MSKTGSQLGNPAPDLGPGPDRASGALKLLTLNTHKGFTSFNRRFVLHDLRES